MKMRKYSKTRVCEAYLNRQEHVTLKYEDYKGRQNQIQSNKYTIFEKYWGANRKVYN
jgi:hypothetical protein